MADFSILDFPAVRLKGDRDDATAIAATLSTPSGQSITATVNAPDLSNVSATLKGESGSPIAATLSTPPGGSVVATVNTPGIDLGAIAATVNGGAPFAVSGPAGNPISADVTAHVGGTTTPISVSLSALQIGAFSVRPDLKVRFSLFGIPICSVRVAGTTDVV